MIDPEGKIVRTFASVNPTRHSPEMLATIDKLVSEVSEGSR